MEEPEQQQIVYITNLENGLRKDGTEINNEEGPNDKKPAVRNRLIEEPSLNNLNHVFEMYEESGSDVDYIEDSLKGENKKNSKEKTTLIWMRKRKESNIITIFQEKRQKMRKLWSQRKWGCQTLGKTFS